MDRETIDRVYRALFVYTLGFHELINQVTTTLGKSFGIVADIWKVYASLLEHSCEHNHKLFVGECKVGLKLVIREHKEKVDQMEGEFAEKLTKKREMEAQLACDVEEKEKYLKELEQERDAYRKSKQEMEAEIALSSKLCDKEIQLRMKFEAKINQIHFVYNDLQARVFYYVLE
eukprot:TRINITY_DN1862_c0_g2_i2.p2 TRINITY_DN1862_c0_g2~~TRINITY_DN1862_c0_g2_i2.p2  ORF type:complete len:174 (-),score=56.30 TRINITY_DN1862_c0_g2_i2:298-819(-)